MEKLIYYVGDVGPETTALFIHTKNIAKILTRLGCRVEFFDYAYGQKQEQMGEYLHHHVAYDRKDLPVVRVFQRMGERIWGGKLFRRIREQCVQNKPDAVILFGFPAEKKIVRYCRKQGIPVYVDRCDWFERDHYGDALERNCLYYQEQELMSRWDPRTAGVIAISQYLGDYYKNLGANTLVLPPVFDLQNPEKPRQRKEGEPLRLVYAGSASKENKDILWPAIEAVSRINGAENAVEFHIIGPNETYIREKLKQQPLSMAGITVHGRLPHDQTEQMVAASDFSLLLRQNKRYAKAGFSTKFTESMVCGVPVICNRVGGADQLLTDMENGVVLNSSSAEEIECRLRQLLTLSEEELRQLKENTAEFARKHFDLKGYEDPLRRFLERGREKWNGESLR